MQIISKKAEFISEKEEKVAGNAERAAAKAELEQGHLPANASMPAIIARLTVLETYLGIKESE